MKKDKSLDNRLLHAVGGKVTLKGVAEYIEELLNKGANPNAKSRRKGSKGWTPLMFTANKWNELDNPQGVAESLIKHGAEVNVKDGYGLTPLKLAVLCGIEPTKFFLEHGADTEYGQYYYRGKVNGTPLSIAFELLWTESDRMPKEETVEVIKALLEHGASIGNASTVIIPPREIPTVLIALQKAPELIEPLLKHGLNPNGDVYRGQPILMWALLYASEYYGEETKKKVISSLLKHRANPNIKDKFGNTPLMMASLCSEPELAKMLLDYGADPNIKNGKGKTAFTTAKEGGHTDIVSLLANYKPNKKAEDSDTLEP